MTRSIRPASARGFSLMEMLVTLMLVSFATMLMFQMLGSYRIALERVQGQAATVDRRVLFAEWFRDSVHGLFIAKNVEFDGDERHFRGISLNPLFASEGAPTRVEWRLEQDGGRAEIVYVEDGKERLRIPLEGTPDAHFSYLDEAGKSSARWPPQLGDYGPSSLPAVVVLVRAGEAQPLTAAVMGPLKPVLRTYGEEEI